MTNMRKQNQYSERMVLNLVKKYDQQSFSKIDKNQMVLFVHELLNSKSSPQKFLNVEEKGVKMPPIMSKKAVKV